MGWLGDKLAKWARKITENAGSGIREKVLEGHEILATASPEERAEWSRQAMERLAELVPDPKIREKIMVDRSCVFIEEFGSEPLLKLRKVFAETGSVEAVIEEMCRDNYKYAKPYREGDIVYETKNPSDPEGFKNAKTDYERQITYCHCPLARAARIPVPEPYCYCGGGWYAGIWEFIIQKPVRIELLKSIMKGDDHCTFAIHLPDEVVY